MDGVVNLESAAWLLLTTAVAVVSGAISGRLSAASARREAKRERIREEVLRWANPILNTVQSLESRLRNILDDHLFAALDADQQNNERPAHRDWSIGYSYAMPSTIFLFADYFAWLRLLQERLSFELFSSQETKDKFFDAVQRVSDALAQWPDDRVYGRGHDAQVFSLQQRAIGELLIQRSADDRVMGYPEFVAALSNDKGFRDAVAPLRGLLEGVAPGTKRWARLQVTLQALQELKQQCEELLGLERVA